MENNISLRLLIFLILVAFVSCEKKTIDYSNIEDLYAQPLPVIQKCVEGKWKVYKHYVIGIGGGTTYPENSYVYIQADRIIKTWDNGLNQRQFL
jgi:hypothetical protein